MIVQETGIFCPMQLAIEIFGRHFGGAPFEDTSSPYGSISLPRPVAYDKTRGVRTTKGKASSPKQALPSSFLEQMLYYCCLRSRTKENFETYQESCGPEIGTTDRKEICELGGDFKEEWQRLKPRIEEIVRRTPAKSGPMPAITVHGLMVGRPPLPTILISSSSKIYATQLKKAIEQNGTLNATNFRVKSLDAPIVHSVTTRKTKSV
jgi:hypothetical protein